MVTAKKTLAQTTKTAVKVTVNTLRQMKQDHRPIAMLTAYDYPTSKIIDEAGIDVILVGDSVGQVVLGYKNTLPVTLAEILHHTKAVRRGVTKALLVADMPFMSYQADKKDAVKSAGALIKQGGAEAVKLEGADFVTLGIIKHLVAVGIPVMGHIGMQPQSHHSYGGFKVQGKTSAAAKKLLDQAKKLEKAGAFAIVLELIPDDLAKKITKAVKIPTIGIGAGSQTDGQVQVLYDLIGLTAGPAPKHAWVLDDLSARLKKAVDRYSSAVRNN